MGVLRPRDLTWQDPRAPPSLRNDVPLPPLRTRIAALALAFVSSTTMSGPGSDGVGDEVGGGVGGEGVAAAGAGSVTHCSSSSVLCTTSQRT